MLPWLVHYQQQLEQLLHNARLAHGLLFIGPAGIGKTALANWLSAALLCTDAQKPCKACKSCLLRIAGSHSDLLVVDSSGSSIGVDAVRQLSVFMQGRAQQQLLHVGGCQRREAFAQVLQADAGAAVVGICLEVDGARPGDTERRVDVDVVVGLKTDTAASRDGQCITVQQP
mgnify:CR=1 FL=1